MSTPETKPDFALVSSTHFIAKCGHARRITPTNRPSPSTCLIFKTLKQAERFLRHSNDAQIFADSIVVLARENPSGFSWTSEPMPEITPMDIVRMREMLQD